MEREDGIAAHPIRFSLMTAIAVREIEASALPNGLELPGYQRALLLIRYHGRAVGHGEVAVSAGRIDVRKLRQAVVDYGGSMIAHRRLEELLHVEPVSTEPPSCTVAVCTRDRPEDLALCLEALMALPDEGQEFLVIDSASKSAATRDLVARYPRVRYIREERPGLDRARNRALREATREVVAYTDDDAVPDAEWLRALSRGFTSPRIMAVTGLTIPLELETEAQIWFERNHGFGRGYWPRVFDGLEVDAFTVAKIGAGVNMALRRSVLELIGPFDEALDAGTPSQSGGDHDIFSRILAAGYSIGYEPGALSRHRHRREWAELERAVYGYGVGVYAFITSQVLRGEWSAPWLALRWMPWQLRLLVRGLLGRPGGVPLHLALTELRGCAAGAFAYIRARRRLETR